MLLPPLPFLWLVGMHMFFNGSDTFVQAMAWANVLAIVIGLALFNSAVARKYRGISKTFLGWAYLLGQIIVCCSLWLGILLPAYLRYP
ncbi:MAG: hypothetical protein EOP88_25945 [Verrucomicrobiaceae bacterium]|nr:MAG: hypothetical protein EOP88_25945 [Verrucomicrobiaceae bacterium]